MPTLSFLTGNRGKFNEIAHFLADSGVELKQLTVDLDEIQEVDAKAVIAHKANEAIRQGYKNFFLEDTSLYISGLGNLPGPLIKWFLQELNPAGIAKLAMRNGKTTARAETIIAYVNAKKEIHYFLGKTTGRIVRPRGTGDFGWGSIFQPTGSRKTFAQLSKEEKHRCSMRIKAFRKFQTYLMERKMEKGKGKIGMKKRTQPILSFRSAESLSRH